MEARSEAERRQKQRDRERAGLLEKQLVENATQQMKGKPISSENIRTSVRQVNASIGIYINITTSESGVFTLVESGNKS